MLAVCDGTQGRNARDTIAAGRPGRVLVYGTLTYKLVELNVRKQIAKKAEETQVRQHEDEALQQSHQVRPPFQVVQPSQIHHRFPRTFDLRWYSKETLFNPDESIPGK